MKYYNYTLIQVDGRIEKMRCPTLFSPDDIKNKLPHSEVIITIPAGSSMYVDSRWDINDGKIATSNEHVWIDNNLTKHVLPYLPKTDSEFTQYWNSYLKKTA